MSGGLVGFPSVDTLIIHFQIASVDLDVITQTADLTAIVPIAVGGAQSSAASATPGTNTNNYFLPGPYALGAVSIHTEAVATNSFEFRVWKNGNDDAPQTTGAAVLANFSAAGAAQDFILVPVAAAAGNIYYSQTPQNDPVSSPTAGAYVFNDTNKVFAAGDRCGITLTSSTGTSTPTGLLVALTFCRIGNA